MRVIDLHERLKSCRLVLFALNKLMERKYLSKARLNNPEKVLEALRISLKYVLIFQESLNGFFDPKNPYLNVDTNSRASISLNSPLKRKKTSSISLSPAHNVNSIENHMKKRLSKGFGSPFSDELDSGLLDGFYFDESMKRKRPSDKKREN